ncbi:MAG: class I SAM-dependent methyltransferase [Actinobacteria bacterium]|nr:class I SAM-dependent methyltransferase [Actinomycetota bacterium]
MADETPRAALRRMLGHVAGKRVLELGCGPGEAAIGLAREGATVIAIDSAAAHADAARAAAQEAEVRLEFHATDLADLAFLRADSVDVAVSADALAGLPDLDRVFRQVHRVLRTGGIFAFALPHPMALCMPAEATPEGALPLTRPSLTRSYFDDGQVNRGTEAEPVTVYPHQIGTVFTSLQRAGFRIDTLLEPEPPRGAAGRVLTPEAVLWRAKKEGV